LWWPELGFQNRVDRLTAQIGPVRGKPAHLRTLLFDCAKYPERRAPRPTADPSLGLISDEYTANMTPQTFF
jgi:hypothetical protein